MVFFGRKAGMTLRRCAAEAGLKHPMQASRILEQSEKAVEEAAAE